ncbi:MAG: hypothetical protein Q8Q09_18825 [Deltaproteobacteria bacterium]|nr:hypothetical protein [Deltaproteobacteria bacterium]
MSPVGYLHVLSACALVPALLTARLSLSARLRALASRAAGALALTTLASALWALPGFESGHRRAVYAQSLRAGSFLDRHLHWGFAAAALALALALHSARTTQDSPRTQTTLSTVALIAAMVSLCAVAMSHAIVPTAALD